MYFIPSWGRADKVERLITHSKPAERAVLILDEDDREHYREVEKLFPEAWEAVVFPADRVGIQVNRAFAEFPNEPFYGCMADDLLPEPGWDTELAKLAGPKTIIWPRDGVNDRCTHPLLGGDIVRAAGFIAPPGFKHFYIDNVWSAVADALGMEGLVDINVNHMHFSVGKAQYDHTYQRRPRSQDDFKVYSAFMRNDFAAMMERIKCCI